MKAEVIACFKDEEDKAYYVGNLVTITWNNGGGCGGCQITKITKTGFHYIQGKGREKSAQFENIKSLRLYN